MAAENIQDIAVLYEIANALHSTIDLKKSLYAVLEILSSSLNMKRGPISILDPLRDEIRIEVAHKINKPL